CARRFRSFRCCSTDSPRRRPRPIPRTHLPRHPRAQTIDRTSVRNWFRRNAQAGAGREIARESQSARVHYSSSGVAFHYLAIEGPIGVGKTRLAERLAERLEATTILEDNENPFLAEFYANRRGGGLEAQLFFLL